MKQNDDPLYTYTDTHRRFSIILNAEMSNHKRVWHIIWTLHVTLSSKKKKTFVSLSIISNGVEKF